MLLNSGVEVHQSKAQFFADGRVYGPGSFVVSMAQPKQGLVRWMLGPHVLSRQLLHARPRGQSDPPVRHVHRHVRRVHGRAQRSGRREDHGGSGQADGARAADRAPCAASAPQRLRAEREAERQLPRGEPAARQGRGRAPRRARATASRPATSSCRGGSSAMLADVAKQTGVDFTASRRRRRRTPTRSASRASRCTSATAAATWTRAGRG